MNAEKSEVCPCGSGSTYASCCQPLHRGQPASCAEALMRSRYCAYVLDIQAYLQSSWHASTRPSTDHDEPAEPVRWLGLQIKRHRHLAPDRAEVEFVARYRQGSRGAVRLHETSTFVREQGHWFYLDGKIHQR